MTDIYAQVEVPTSAASLHIVLLPAEPAGSADGSGPAGQADEPEN